MRATKTSLGRLLVASLTILATAAQAQFNFTTNNNAITITGYTGSDGVVVIPAATNGFPVIGIGAGAFNGNSSLISVTIPNGVTSIESQTFSHCGNLIAVSIPDSVTNIGDAAFQFTALRDVTIPGSVTSIGDSAFKSCAIMLNVTIPGSITNIGSSAFESCADLTNFTIPSGVTSIQPLTFYNCTGLTNITVPASVTSIGAGAFQQCTKLVTTTVPSAVTSISDNTFNGCTRLITLTIPSGVTNIGVGAFAACSTLTSLEVPGGVTLINDHTFDGCSSLTNLTIPNSVTSIGLQAFRSCESLVGITLPNGITNIGSGAFQSCKKLAGITLPDGLAGVASEMFGSCSNLSSVTIPNSVTLLDVGVFEFCTSLTNITIPDSVTEIGSSAFQFCSSLRNITLPSGLTNIAPDTFLFCTSLTNCTLPNGLVDIEVNAFLECHSLSNIAIPSGVTNVGSGAFDACGSMTAINVDAANGNYSSIAGVLFDKSQQLLIVFPRGKGGSYSIPGSVTSVEAQAFSGCVTLTNVTIPASVASIGIDAFLGCAALSAINVDGGNPNYSSANGVLFNKSQTSLLDFPKGKGGNYAIPNTVTSIEPAPFQYCANLAGLTIPSSVTNIGDYAFYFCIGLTNVSLPAGLTNIGAGTFSSCSSLSSITIPASVINIESLAFEACTNLTSVYFQGNAPAASGAAFYGDSQVTVYYQAGTSGWGTIYSGYPAVPAAPAITLQPASASKLVGASNTLLVGARGLPPLNYQWQFDGIAIPGATASSYVAGSLALSNNGSYSVVVTNKAGSITSLSAVLTVNEGPSPTLTLVQPAANQTISISNVFTATGTARGNLPVSNVLYQLNGGAWQSTATANGWTNWTAVLNNQLLAGTNTLSAKAVDVAGNTSPALTPVKFFFAVPATLSLATNGGGSIIPTVSNVGTPTNGARLQVNRSYTVTATAAANYYFTNWLSIGDNGTNYYATNVLCFLMQSNLSLTANFYTNAPRILAQPTPLTLVQGQSARFSVTAVGAGLTYQWQQSGITLPGATFASYTNLAVQTNIAGTYSVIITNCGGAITSNPVRLTVKLDTNKPTVAIYAPPANFETDVNQLSLSGTALDNARVTQVLLSLNGAPFAPVNTLRNVGPTAANWTNLLTLAVGTNNVRVYAVDFVGNCSLTNSRNFFLRVPSILTLTTNGDGTTSTNLVAGVAVTNDAILFVGRAYSVTALPTLNRAVFTNWLINPLSGSPTVYPMAKLNFIMQSNLYLTANFVPTPFVSGIAGTYNGLFYETNGVSFSSSGFLKLTVNSNGVANGNIYLAGGGYSFADALFDASGHANITVSRAGSHQPNLLLDLNLDLTGASGMMNGTVSTVSGLLWSAPYAGDLASFDNTNNPTTNAGKYTFIIPGTNDPAFGPVGDGFGAVTVASNGVITLMGTLGDGVNAAQVAPNVSISRDGLWPLYMNLYAGKGGGSLLGWLSLSNAPGIVTNLTGTVVWKRLASPTNLAFAAGFDRTVELSGSGYVIPAPNKRVLALTNAAFVVSEWDWNTNSLAWNFLPRSTNLLALGTGNALTVVGTNANRLKVTLFPANGFFSGSFVDTNGVTNAFSGAVLQNATNGAGLFLNNTNTGQVLLLPH